ncbi:unnamed protein product [Psylliodes chrysocephalus]|nr:unnamed protein product [Psylliodes chrysocephala]
MVETGSYNVNKKRRRDTSFKSFICALLAFLAMLILISLLLYALRNKAGGGDDLDTKRDDRFELEFLKGKNNTKKENKTLVVSTVSTTTTAQNTTTTPSTSSTHENANSIIKNLTEDESSTTTLLPSTDRNANLIPENSTEDQITTTTLLPSTDRNANLITENSTEDQITTTNKIRSTTEEYIFPDDESGTPTRYTTVGPTPDPVPTTCKNGICKRAASSMLAIMNHDDKLNRCEDYYKFICEGPEQNDEHAFFHESFKGFVKKINEVTPTSEKYMTLFADFYKSCNEFGNSINRLERLKCLIGTEGADLTKSVTTAILAQTLPFFDIGLNINGKNFKLEINLPGLSYLKTTLKDWSLMEQLTDTCINKQSDEINQNVIELDKISTNITKCIDEKATQYVKDFVNEMKQLSVLSGFEFLDANVKAATQNDDLIEILNVVQESLAAYRNTNLKKLKETTLLDLNKNYDFGLDWIELFKGITNDLTVDEKTVVYQSEHLEEVFKKLIEKKANLQPLVDLWHNIELYKNIVIEKEIDDRGFNCLEITSELMPEVSSAIISELNANDQQDFYKEVESLMNNLKSNVYTSFTQANMTTESADVLQDRLSEIKIIMPSATPEVDKLNYRKVFDPNDPYPKKMVSLISHFRKTLFGMHDNVVVGDTL